MVRWKRFRPVIYGLCALSIFLMGHLLMRAGLTLAQTTPSQAQSPDGLVRQAQLAASQEQFPQAVQQYARSLKLYRQAGDRPHELETRQALANDLQAAQPWADEQEQQIKQEIATFVKQFPQRDSNATATQLEQIVGSEFRFGIRGTSNTPTLPPLPPTEAQEQKQNFDQLENYFNALSYSRGDDLAGFSSETVAYLKKKGAAIEQIETLLQTQEVPQWPINLSYIELGNINYVYPSFLRLVEVQRLILADAILKNSPARKREQLKALEASWKLSQSLWDDPSLISQLFSLVSMRLHASVLRQLGVLPTEWQTRLTATDLRLLMVKALTSESSINYLNHRQIQLAGTQDESEDYWWSLKKSETEIGFDQWPKTMQQSYLQWSAIRNYHQRQQLYSQLRQQNICTYDPISEAALLQQLGVEPEEKYRVINWVSQWLKAGRVMLELELTQKILQFKQDALNRSGGSVNAAGERGETLVVCPDRQWMYRTSVYGQTMISIDPFPVWLGSSSSSSSKALSPVYVVEPPT